MNNFLPSALVKISWKTGADGLPLQGLNVAEGGICGTCFSLNEDATYSASHHLMEIFRPNDGFDSYAVWVVHADGQIHEIDSDRIEAFEGFDICRIDCPSASRTYSLSTVSYDDVNWGRCTGYEASKAPFTVTIEDGRLSLENIDLSKALLTLEPQPLERKILQVKALDVSIAGKRGYVIKQKATIGLSGGPLLDPVSGAVLGVCCMGLPVDVHEKSFIGIVDLRDLIEN